MGFSVIDVFEIADKNVIEQIMNLPEYRERLEDGCCVLPPPDDTTRMPVFIGARYENEPLGAICCFEVFSSSSIKCHVFVLPEYRRDHRKFELVKKIETAFWADFPLCKTLVTFAPSCFPQIEKFAKALGFKVAGKIPSAYKHKGVYSDLSVLYSERPKG